MICNIQENFAYIEVPEIMFDAIKLRGIVYKLYQGKVDIKKQDGYIVVETTEPDAPTIVRDIFSIYYGIDANFLGHDIKDF